MEPIDTRNFKFKAARARQDDVEESSSSGEEAAARYNPFTGHATRLGYRMDEGAPSDDEGTPKSAADFLNEALQHVQGRTLELGFAPGEPAEFLPDPSVQTLSSGMRSVSLIQHHHGIPIHDAEPKVWFGADRRVEAVVGDTVSVPPDLPPSPSVSAATALLVAARAVAEPESTQDVWGQSETRQPRMDLSSYVPRSLGAFPLPSLPTLFDAGPFGEPIPAHLVYFYQGETTRLAWKLLISRPGLTRQYVVMVEADARTKDLESPQILFAMPTDAHAVKAEVYLHNPARGARSAIDFPRSVDDYPIPGPHTGLPQGFPHSWCEEAGGALGTVGNNTAAVNRATGRSAQAMPRPPSDFEFKPLANSDDELVVNLFYFCNFMHDFFVMLGFDEAAGNFQAKNISGVGGGADPVDAIVHPGPVDGTANMLTRADGVRAVMNMGLVEGTGRHTALDSDVVFHEFVHGVSNRLVGGMRDAQGLQMPQSRGMGEGWSDYFALTVQNFDLTPERTVTGDWVTNRSGGIRMHPYTDTYPGRFGDIGRAPQYFAVHNIGEIWCAALMQMNRNLGSVLGARQRGHIVGWQAVVDGLKLTPKNPSFLMARDAVLRALQAFGDAGRLTATELVAARRAAWEAFAKFGMGARATCPNASLTGCVGDASLPPGV